MTRKFWITVYWSGVALAVCAAIAYEVFTFARNIPPYADDSVIVFIQPKSTLREISKTLGDAGAVAAPWKFTLLTRILRKQAVLRPGEYRFDVPTPPLQALRILIEGKVIIHRVTFPEGFTADEIAHTLDAKGLVPYADFRAQLGRKDLPGHFGLPGETLEGFLFPDTYLFTKTDGAFKIIETMVARFKQAALPEEQAKAAAAGLPLLEWVTLASIIEKESGIPEEQRTVSSVFHNRLKRKMRLQSDPTVIYGIPDFNGNITKKDLLTPTPYNTYTRTGLPPGPIANPGAGALHAAANPEKTGFLYFVATKKGGHLFSKTYEEHQRAVSIYQLHQRPAASN